MPSSAHSESVIPIVDFAQWSNDEQRQHIAQKLVDACRDVGFVYIVNHGVPESLLDEAFTWSKKLFDLSHEEKMLALHPPGPDVHRGYSYPGLEKVSQVYGNDADEAVGRELREVKDCKVGRVISAQIKRNDSASRRRVTRSGAKITH